MNIIKRLLAEMYLTRATDKKFKDVGEMLENMDTVARKEFKEASICIK